MNTQSTIVDEIPDYSEMILEIIKEMEPIAITDEEVQENAHEKFKKMQRDYNLPAYITTYNQPLDKIITRYLTTLVPDTTVALGNGMPLKKVERWLNDSKYMMNSFIQRIHGDILAQERLIRLHRTHINRVKELKLDGMEERLGSDVMRHIYDFLPYSAKANAYLCFKDNQIEDLMKLKVHEIRLFSETLYRHYVAYSRVRTDVTEIRIKFYEVAHRPGVGRKIDMLNDLFDFIKKCLQVKTKKSEVRNYFVRHAYKLCRLMIYKAILVKRKIIRDEERKHINKELANIERKLKKSLRELELAKVTNSTNATNAVEVTEVTNVEEVEEPIEIRIPPPTPRPRPRIIPIPLRPTGRWRS